MRKQVLLWAMLMGATAVVCGAQERPDTVGVVRPDAEAMSMGQFADSTEQFRKTMDSLGSIAPQRADVYGQLALIHWHRAKQSPPDSWQSMFDSFKMTTYHLIGQHVDSVALYTYYNSRIPPMGDTMRMATSAAEQRKLGKRINAHFERAADDLNRWADRLTKSLENVLKGK